MAVATLIVHTFFRQNRAPPRPPKGLLSLRDYTVIHAALEIVVHWGITPVLEPGVGVFDAEKRPRSRVIKISHRVLQWGGEEKSVAAVRTAVGQGHLPFAGDCDDRCGDGAGGDDGTGRAAAARLAMCADVVQDVVFTQQFMPMLMPLYLPDLLAARLQLVYGRDAGAAITTPTSAAFAAPSRTQKGAAENPPIKSSACVEEEGGGVDQANSNSTDMVTPVASAGTILADQCHPTAAHLTTANGVLNIDEKRREGGAGRERAEESKGAEGTDNQCTRREYAESLRKLLRELGPRQVMGALRHLLSQGARAPPWLRQRAGRILSQIVLRRGGVQATLEVYLASTGSGGTAAEGAEGDEMRACLRVARLLAAPPKSVSAREYVSRVAPQLAEMLHYDGQQRAIITRQGGQSKIRYECRVHESQF